MKVSNFLITGVLYQLLIGASNGAVAQQYVGDFEKPERKHIRVEEEKHTEPIQDALKAPNDSGTPTTPTQSPSSAVPGTKPADSSKPTAASGKTEESDEIKLPKNFIHSSTVLSKSNCKIKVLDPHAANEDAAQVIDILQKIYVAYADKDLDYIGEHLAQDCITFYEGDKKVISGKQAALDDIKEWTEKEAKKTDAPLIEIVLEHPYCNVNGDHAVITFTAIKEIGGSHPGKAKSHVNDVFKKNEKSWELLTHYRSNWKELN